MSTVAASVNKSKINTKLVAILNLKIEALNHNRKTGNRVFQIQWGFYLLKNMVAKNLPKNVHSLKDVT